MTSWRRNTFTSTSMGPAFNWEDAIAAGDSYMRVHLRWGFHLDAPVTTDIAGICSNLVTLGLVTTIGNGSETRPNARSGSGDAAPPTQRWIFWETRAPVVTAIDDAAGVITFRDSGSTEPTDTKGRRLAQPLVSLGIGLDLRRDGQHPDMGVYVHPSQGLDSDGEGQRA